jgi:hypothetical protein
MHKKIIFISTFILLLSLTTVLTIYAGSLEPTSPPDSTFSYTLEDIYNRLNDGTAATPGAFREPESGPGTGTMHTLDEIYELIGIRALVTKTGDTYNDPGVTGEDGEMQKGGDWPNPRFTDNGNGTVTDHLTGLIWLKDAGCLGQWGWYDGFAQISAFNAGGIVSCADYTAGSFDDWRMPNVRELESLVDYGRWAPCLPLGHPFVNIPSRRQWTSTSNTGRPELAWTVGLHVGGVHDFNKTYQHFVWPVRGGP